MVTVLDHEITAINGLQAALDSKSAVGHTHEGGYQHPIGSVVIHTVSTDPATLLGYGTWALLCPGRTLVCIDSGDTDFDTVKETRGAKNVTPAGTVSTPTFTGTPFTAVINHTHPVDITDGGHNHTQNAHTHTQDAHTHTQNSHNHTQDAHSHVVTSQTATTGSATSYEHGVLDTSSAEAEATETTATTVATNQAATAVNQNATATNQNATATNIANTTGVTASSSNPAGGVASITPAGTVSTPTFTGTEHSNLQPLMVVYMWERTA